MPTRARMHCLRSPWKGRLAPASPRSLSHWEKHANPIEVHCHFLWLHIFRTLFSALLFLFFSIYFVKCSDLTNIYYLCFHPFPEFRFKPCFFKTFNSLRFDKKIVFNFSTHGNCLLILVALLWNLSGSRTQKLNIWFNIVTIPLITCIIQGSSDFTELRTPSHYTKSSFPISNLISQLCTSLSSVVREHTHTHPKALY